MAAAQSIEHRGLSIELEDETDILPKVLNQRYWQERLSPEAKMYLFI